MQSQAPPLSPSESDPASLTPRGRRAGLRFGASFWEIGRGGLAVWTLCAVLALVAFASAWPQNEVGFENLLPPKSLEGWQHFFADQAQNGHLDPKLTFVVKDDIVHATGQPLGYLRTKTKYRNYILRVRWKYSQEGPGNSGLLLHLQEPDKIWPRCFQVQMQTSEPGAMFPLGEAKSNRSDPHPDALQPLRPWNDWEVTALQGKITLRVLKGEQWVQVGEISGCEPAEGFIGLQSEGTPIEFSLLQIKRLPEEPTLP